MNFTNKIIFLRERKKNMLVHGLDFNKRFPPSWKYREMIILDNTKPILEELKIVD